MACETPFRDDSEQRLLYKIASCCFGGGSGGAGVSSFNGRTGAVTLLASDVSGVADDLYVNETGDSMTGALSIDNGILAANDPALELSQTWNNAAVDFKAFTLNVTNTAAGSGSMLLDIQQDAITRFTIFENGSLVRFVSQEQTDTGLGLFLRKRGTAVDATAAIASGGGLATIFFSGWNGAAMVQAASIQTFADELFTGLVNGSRMEFYTTPIGSATPLINLRLSSTGQAQLRDGSAALPALTFQGDPDTGIYRTGANSIGFSASGAVVLTVYSFGAELPAAGSFFWTGSSVIGAPSNGVIRLSNAAGTDFERLQFGGTTAAFPSIKRNGAGLDFRLADDSGYAAITTAAITMSTAAPLSITSGANQRAGNATLVAGTVTVANTSVTANTIVLLTRKTAGGTVGTVITYTVTAATSFTINSDSALDTSTFSYLLIEVP